MWISAPAGLWIYRCVVRESDSGYSLEEAALPLPDGVTLVEDLTRHGEFAEKSFERTIPEMRCDCLTIHRTDSFDGLGENLEHCVIEGVTPVISVDAGNFFVPPKVVVDLWRIDHAASTQNILGCGAELLRKALKGRRHAAEIGFHLEVFDLGLFGKTKEIRAVS